MGLDKHISTQTAILLAGAMIAAGLFFGLRGREPPPPPSPAAPSPNTSYSTESAPARPTAEAPSRPPDVAPPAAPVPPDNAAVAAAALKEMERHRATVGSKCFPPGSPPGKTKVQLNITFAPGGTELTRGIREYRDAAVRGTGQCINDALPPLKVPAPGSQVFVEIDWSLP